VHLQDEIELDALVNQPLVAKIPVVKNLVVLGSQALTGTKPVWYEHATLPQMVVDLCMLSEMRLLMACRDFRYIQEELLDHQKGKADSDIKLRKALTKGLKKDQ
jgi:hypothetical protein